MSGAAVETTAGAMTGSNPRATPGALQNAGTPGAVAGRAAARWRVATRVTPTAAGFRCLAAPCLAIVVCMRFRTERERRRKVMTKLRTLVMLAVASAAVLVTTATVRAAATPEDTVRQYLKAMQDQKYEEAYKQISKAMTGGKDSEAWAKEQKYMMQSAEVKIFKFDVYAAKVAGSTAKVPNILSSQDKFLNQLGADEYELYTVIKENGDWKIDQQEQVDKSEQPKWFTKKAG
jgi:hypothetical protein